ncbi:MAG: response regulator, partial [Deltaproteobacteria bacterium]|nr:response regulator [Deltaproteobacteria bacterium]
PQIPGHALEEGEIFSPSPLPGGTESVLIIDDEVSLAQLGGKMLAELGYRVDINTSGLNALTLIEASPDRFDLVVTDHMMPDMTGLDLALALKKICPDLPVILCTGFSGELDRGQIDRTGIKEILMKPLLTRKLAEAVRKVLDGWRAEVIRHSGDQ